MTLDESDLTKRLLMISQAPALLRILMILIGTDYSKWNIRWTNLSTHPFFQTLDHLFGTPNLYTYTHPFFSESLVSLASFHNPPSTLMDYPEGPPEECVDPLLCAQLNTHHCKAAMAHLSLYTNNQIDILLIQEPYSYSGVPCYIPPNTWPSMVLLTPTPEPPYLLDAKLLTISCYSTTFQIPIT